MFGTICVGECFIPPDATAVVTIVHGLGEHRGRYAEAVRRFAHARVGCVSFDQRGHGESPGARADIDRFATYVADLGCILSGVAALRPELPHFVWGHSMGSLVAISQVAVGQRHVRGVITTGCPVAAFPAAFVALARALRPLLALGPGPRRSTGLDPAKLSHAERVIEQYRDDPLVVRSMTARLLIEMAAASGAALRHAPQIEVPWLAAHGGEDEIAPPRGSHELIERLGSADKRLAIFDGFRHEVHNETPERAEKFYRLCIDWIGERAT